MEEKRNDPTSTTAATEQSAAKPKKREVLSMEEVAEMAPWFKKHPKLLRRIFKLLAFDKVNGLHSRNVDNPGGGPGFTRGLLQELDIKVEIEGEDVLDRLPDDAFITVSNHHFGAMDGIILIDIFGHRREKYKVMVNMILNHISGMRPSFIAVDPLASDDPKKKAVSMKGIKESIMHVRRGNPLGFFPAGAVAKVNLKGRLVDLPWQPSIIRLIEQMNVPVVPVFFHGSQSWFFNFLGTFSWKLRTMRHPVEVFNKRGKTFRVTIGDIISVDEQKAHQGSIEEFGKFLRERTYALRNRGK